jgi:hypothetical protein
MGPEKVTPGVAFNRRARATGGNHQIVQLGQRFGGVEVVEPHPFAGQDDQRGVEKVDHGGKANREIAPRAAKDGAGGALPALAWS